VATSQLRETGRHLNAAEQEAAALIHQRLWPVAYSYGRGPVHMARGTYWQDRLRELAAEWERLARAARLVADAMDREEP